MDAVVTHVCPWGHPQYGHKQFYLLEQPQEVVVVKMFLYLAGEAVLPWVVEAVADAHFLCRSIPHAAQLVVEVQPLGEVVDLPLTDLLPAQTLAA